MSSSPQDSVLVAQQVSKKFAGSNTFALNEISLTVHSGEFYSFLGPSGCGKTTLLRIFAGFEEPTSGQIAIGGQNMVGVPPYKRPVNMVFQSYALFPHMSVQENVAFGLRTARKLKNFEIAEQTKEALKIIRLEQYAERLPAQLSGGQQQRVALARALVMRPVVLLLDEPLSALDVRIREEMQDELSRLKRELNLTFVMVTHDQAEALAISTRVAVFNAGNLEQVGSPAEIYEHPKTAFTAAFIGRSNLLPGEIVTVDDANIVVEFGGNKIICSAVSGGDNSAHFKSGEAAFVCFKPEAVKVRARSKQSNSLNDCNSLSCTLQTSAYQGNMVDVKLTVDARPDSIVRALIPASQMAEVTAAAASTGLEFYVEAAANRVLPGAPL